MSRQGPNRPSLTSPTSPTSNGRDLPKLYDEALNLATKATQADVENHFDVAMDLYSETAAMFLRILNLETDVKKRGMLISKAKEYVARAETLKPAVLKENSRHHEMQRLDTLYRQADFAQAEATVEDGEGNVEEAIYQYMCAIDSLIQLMKLLPDTDSTKPTLRERVGRLLGRAEELKGQKVKPKVVKKQQSTLMLQELKVIRNSSTINGHTFLPWIDMDLRERFSYMDLFEDSDGLLPLSAKQQARFGSWKRPFQIMSNPKVIYFVSSATIIQDVVTDCSFVASLCVSASYERRFKKQLITSTIFPQNSKGEPMYNPSGKYMVKLYFNGVHRKVIVDDLLPVSKDGTLMCTYSRNRNELWPSIVEKAYMKLMGGYDFPGSNSGIDLHALTGWIPEHIFIREKYFNSESTWLRLMDGQKYGDALITIATGELSPDLAQQLGLVPTHAYAVLDVQEVLGRRLLQVKNPWSHKRWTGPFSHVDQHNWTPELKHALNYDQLGALQNDDGIFWIDYDSICRHFDSIHMNWNPELFRHRYVLHMAWPFQEGPKKDNYNLGNNPQFGLEVDVQDEKNTTVWLLLSKHVTIKEENKDYITLHVYADTNCERVYYPENPMIQGVYINSPHVLVRFNAPRGNSRYTVVVSQHEKTKTLNFTLRSYSMSPFKIGEIPRGYVNEERLSGVWNNVTAGGSMAVSTFYRNPQYRLLINNDKPKVGLFAMLEAPRTYPVNIKLVKGGERVSTVLSDDVVATSGDYRHGFCYLDTRTIEAGTYTLIVSTFEPNLQGTYFLTVSCSNQISLFPIPQEGEGKKEILVKGEWMAGISAVGCSHYQNYSKNPKYDLVLSHPTRIKVRLTTPTIQPQPSLNVSVYSSSSPGALENEVASSGPYVDYVQGVVLETQLSPGRYSLVFSTWDPCPGHFEARIFM